MSTEWRFDAIGTRWEIQTSRPLDAAERETVARTVERFDAAWSRFRPDSVVSALGREPGAVAAPPDTVAMLDAFAEASAATAGAVNPLVGASLDALGYDAEISLRAGAPVAAPADWRRLLTWDERMLRLSAPAVIDVGALGKGRLVDRVLNAVGEFGDGDDIVVDASGDLTVRGATVRVGLEHPFDPTRAIGVWEVCDQALCASATNRRAWGDGLHHVLDARTGAPVRTVVATWAVAPEAMLADAAATALFFDGGAALCAQWGVAWVRMLSDGRVEYSPDCPAELFTRGTTVEG